MSFYTMFHLVTLNITSCEKAKPQILTNNKTAISATAQSHDYGVQREFYTTKKAQSTNPANTS